MKIMKKIFYVIGLVAIVASLGACGSKESSASKEGDGGYTKEKPLVIKFSHVTSADSVKGKAADAFAKLVAEKTNGKVKVEVYPSSQLYGDNDELDALASGNVQMISPSATKMVKIDPRWQYVDMPYLFDNEEHVRNFFKSDIAKTLLESDQLAANDIKGLAFWENGFKEFSNNKHPLVNPEDFKGLKFRVQAGKLLDAQFKALHAGSATIAFGESYAALQQGTVDGQENSFNNFDTQKYSEVQKYLTVSDHGRIDYVVFVNKTFWDNIPKDLKAPIEEALAESTQLEWKLAQEENKKSLENIKNTGDVEITELTEAQKENLKKSLQPLYKEFEGEISKELIDGIEGLRK
ncbi:DctP family TRAP transporter solute-binding subunit [Rummeliibacillus sp. JY-2-4R]